MTNFCVCVYKFLLRTWYVILFYTLSCVMLKIYVLVLYLIVRYFCLMHVPTCGKVFDRLQINASQIFNSKELKNSHESKRSNLLQHCSLTLTFLLFIVVKVAIELFIVDLSPFLRYSLMIERQTVRHGLLVEVLFFAFGYQTLSTFRNRNRLFISQICLYTKTSV